MSLTEHNRRLIVDGELRKSREALADADVLVGVGSWNGAASRLYYAVFHAANALLICDGHTVKSHKGSMIMFNKEYVLTGLMPKSFGVLYSQLETLREDSDYTMMYDVEPDKMKTYIPQAREMIAAIEKIITKNKTI